MPGRTVVLKSMALVLMLLAVGARAADTSAPSATLTSAPNVNNSNAASYSSSPYLFTVTYSDDTAIDATTFGNDNILVSGAKGSTTLATFVSATPAGNGTPIIATYQFSPPGGVTNFGNDDAYSISIQPTQVKDTSAKPVPTGKLGAFTISILTITSAPTATPMTVQTGQTVQFVAAASGLGNLTYTWDFRDGITTTGTPSLTGTTNTTSHVYLVTGTFPVQLTVSDAFGQSVTDTVTVTVTTNTGTNPGTPGTPGVPVAGAEDPDADADADGFNNGIETALGSDALNPASTPFSLKANPLPNGVFYINHLIVNLVFNKASSDQIYMTGTLQRTKQFVFNQTTVIVDIGHVVRAFQLDSGGSAVNSVFSNGQVNSIDDSLVLKRQKNGKKVNFQLRIGNGNFQKQFASEKTPDQVLTLDPGKTHIRNVRATIYINNFVFQTTNKARYFVNDMQGKYGR